MSAIVQSKVGAIDAAITLDSAVAAGNHLIALAAYRTDFAVSLSDNRGNTWQSPMGHYYDGNGTVQIQYAENVAAGSTTVTPSTGASGGGYWALMEVSGLQGSSSVDASAENAVTDVSAPFTPSLALTTTVQTFLVVVASDLDNNTAGCTGGAGDIANSISMGAGAGYGYASAVASGARTAGLTFDGPDIWAMQALAFKESAGGPAQLAGGVASQATVAGAVYTPQVSLPVSDITAGSWVANGGGALYAAIDETTASDADYISVAAAGSLCEVKLAAMSDPLSSSGHVLRYRLSSPAGNPVQLTLRQAASTTIAQWTETPGPTLADYAHSLSGAEADSITDYTDLRVRIEAL